LHSPFVIILLISPLLGLSLTNFSYGSSSPLSGNSITVVGTTLNSTTVVNGIDVDLRINGTDVASGYTPITFSNLQQGVQYGVVVYWDGNYYIRYINDSNTGMDLQRYDLVTLNKSNPTDKLTAVFEYVPPSQAASLNIIAQFPNGTQLGTASVVNGYDLHTPGMWLQVVPPGRTFAYTGTYTGGSILPFTLFNHETYTVQMTLGYTGIQFSHWKDNNNTNPDRSITLNGSATLIAIYDAIGDSSTTTSTTSSSTTIRSTATLTSTTSRTVSSSSSTIASSSTSTMLTGSTTSTMKTTTLISTSSIASNHTDVAAVANPPIYIQKSNTTTSESFSSPATGTSSQTTSILTAIGNHDALLATALLTFGFVTAAVIGVRRQRK